ncbi:MAG: DoxX family protein [Myxococcales bacterium]|nr:DoxX family protein [Myxococcales bacterium]
MTFLSAHSVGKAQDGSALVAADRAEAHDEGASKARTIGYRVTTGLLVFCMTGGFFELVGAHTTTDGIMRLGYPAYIIPALGLGKILAILAILWPGLPRLKEWAYAGIFFNMAGAIVSHIARHDPAWSVAVTVTIAGITLASWALRPPSRRLGEIVRLG